MGGVSLMIDNGPSNRENAQGGIGIESGMAMNLLGLRPLSVRFRPGKQ